MPRSCLAPQHLHPLRGTGRPGRKRSPTRRWSPSARTRRSPCCAAVAAYLALFTQFAGYDDEGTLLVTLKAFAHGDILYRDIYSAYGPFYYELFGGLFALTGHAVTTDASRSIVDRRLGRDQPPLRHRRRSG